MLKPTLEYHWGSASVEPPVKWGLGLDPWFSKGSAQTSSSLPWKLVDNVNSQVTQTHESWLLVWDPAICCPISLLGDSYNAQVWRTTFPMISMVPSRPKTFILISEYQSTDHLHKTMLRSWPGTKRLKKKLIGVCVCGRKHFFFLVEFIPTVLCLLQATYLKHFLRAHW